MDELLICFAIQKLVQDESLHVTQSMRVRVLYDVLKQNIKDGNQGGIADTIDENIGSSLSFKG